LIERISAAILAAASERCSQHLSQLPEQRRTQVVYGRCERKTIESVDQLPNIAFQIPLPGAGML